MNEKKESLEIEIIEPSSEHNDHGSQFREEKSKTEHLKIKYSSNFNPVIGTILLPFLLLFLTIFIVPALGIWIWAKVGFLKAFLFGISYIVCVVLWNWVIGMLIAFTGGRMLGVKATIYITITLIVLSVIVNIFLPWVLAGLYLGWLR